MTLLSLNPGTLFAGRYRIVRVIAQGGMGAVYEVIHLETERRRALKVMLPDMLQSQEMRDRFRQEARVTANIESEFLVDVFDAGIDDATRMPFLVMELLRGEEVHKRLKRAGRFEPTDVITFLHQASLALDKTHRASIVHRDLKPGNLFLTERDDGSPRVKVLDFGIAKLVAEGATHAEATRNLGTPVYMAPEQFHMGCKVSPASDIYALGMIAYTLLVGAPYWFDELQSGANVFAFAASAVMGPKESAIARALRKGVGLPAAFDPWFRKVTAMDPLARFQTASSAVIALAEVFGVSLGMQRLPTLTHDMPSPFAPVSTPTPAPRSDAVSAWPPDPRSQSPGSLRQSSGNTGAPLPVMPPQATPPPASTAPLSASMHTPVPSSIAPLISSPMTPSGVPSVPSPITGSVPPLPLSTPSPMTPTAAQQEVLARQSHPSFSFIPPVAAPEVAPNSASIVGLAGSPSSAPGPITPISGPVPPSGGPLMQSGSSITGTPVITGTGGRQRPTPMLLGIAAAISLVLIFIFFFMSGSAKENPSADEQQPADSASTSLGTQPLPAPSIDTSAPPVSSPSSDPSALNGAPPPSVSADASAASSSALSPSTQPNAAGSNKTGKVKPGTGGTKRPTIYTPD